MSTYVVVLNGNSGSANCGIYCNRQKAFDFAEQLVKEKTSEYHVTIEYWLDGNFEDTPYYETGRKEL